MEEIKFSIFTAITVQSFPHKYRRSRIFHQINHPHEINFNRSLNDLKYVKKEDLKNISVPNNLTRTELNKQEGENC